LLQQYKAKLCSSTICLQQYNLPAVVMHTVPCALCPESLH
jgi:hypothetical protein